MLYIMNPAMIASFVLDLDDSASAELLEEVGCRQKYSFSCDDRISRGIS